MFDCHKKESPILSLFGLGGGAGGGLTGGGASGPPGGGPFSVSGGNSTDTPGNGYKYFFFNSSGSLVIANDGTDAPMQADFMLVGEGGQGGSTGGGGGGAGAFIQKIEYDFGPFPGSPTTCPVTIGATSPHPEVSGGGANSAFVIPVNPKTFTAAGGGGGGPTNGSNGAGGGRNNGNGGAPGVDPFTSIDADGNTPDAGIRGTGGDGLLTGIYAGPGGVGGGGGGAGGNGISGSNPPLLAGKGGLGRAAFLGDTGIPTAFGTAGPGPGRWFAGGGGGGNHDSPPTAGGAAPDGGGGGRGANPSPGVAGSPTTGGGAGGGGGLANSSPGPVSTGGGGSGMLIVRISTDILT